MALDSFVFGGRQAFKSAGGVLPLVRVSGFFPCFKWTWVSFIYGGKSSGAFRVLFGGWF